MSSLGKNVSGIKVPSSAVTPTRIGFLESEHESSLLILRSSDSTGWNWKSHSKLSCNKSSNRSTGRDCKKVRTFSLSKGALYPKNCKASFRHFLWTAFVCTLQRVVSTPLEIMAFWKYWELFAFKQWYWTLAPPEKKRELKNKQIEK